MGAQLIGRQLLEDHLHVDATAGIDKSHHEVDHDGNRNENERPTNATGVGQGEVGTAARLETLYDRPDERCRVHRNNKDEPEDAIPDEARQTQELACVVGKLEEIGATIWYQNGI